MRLKVCGVRNKDMLQACEDLEIDYIGLNFVPWSKRVIDNEKVDLFEGRPFKGQVVGVFADQEVDFILEKIRLFSLDVIQLHGGENVEFCTEIQNQDFQDLKIWKAFKIDADFDLKVLEDYKDCVDLFLFDGAKPGSGKTVSAENISSLEQATKTSEDLDVKYGVAGGINPENIIEFTKQYPNAYLLDTASGVEIEGVFDLEKLKELVILNSS